jgi:hypothetical protein
MKDVREAFERALADSRQINAAIAVVQSRLDADADDPVAGAYLGSLNAMKAGAAALPWVKLRHANIAADLLDRAHERRHEVAQKGGTDGHPGELVVLLLRGIAYASFPPFLGRAAAARESLEEAVRHPAFAAVPAVYRALACSHLAILHERSSACDARRMLDAARDADPVLAEAIWARR